MEIFCNKCKTTTEHENGKALNNKQVGRCFIQASPTATVVRVIKCTKCGNSITQDPR